MRCAAHHSPLREICYKMVTSKCLCRKDWASYGVLSKNWLLAQHAKRTNRMFHTIRFSPTFIGCHCAARHTILLSVKFATKWLLQNPYADRIGQVMVR